MKLIPRLKVQNLRNNCTLQLSDANLGLSMWPLPEVLAVAVAVAVAVTVAVAVAVAVQVRKIFPRLVVFCC